VSCGHPCADQHTRIVVVAEAKFAAVDPDDARRAAANHFEASAGTQTQLLEPANLFGGANQLANFGNLAAAKNSEWHQLRHRTALNAKRRLRTILNNSIDRL
jgi:hypothetical protein